MDRIDWIFELTPQSLAEQGRSAEEKVSLFKASGYSLDRIGNGYGIDWYLSKPDATLIEITSTPTMTLDVFATKRPLRDNRSQS